MRPVVSTIGTPAYQLSKYLSKILSKVIDRDWNVDTKFAGLTYVNGLAENLAKLFKEEIPDLSVAFKYTRKAGDYSVIKVKLDHSRKANVVYEIPCRDCDVAYIGQTD